MMSSRFAVSLPDWVPEVLRARGHRLTTPPQRMGLVLELLEQHVRRASGGPFAAAVFDLHGNELISVGLNVVVPSGLSVAHAEVVALSLAQQRLGTHDLAANPERQLELVTSAEPCCMCFGAIHWSGVSSLVCGARDEDVRGIGFDEGPKPEDWVECLRRRNVRVTRDVQRQEAAGILRRYAQAGGQIYNPSLNRGD